MSIEKRPQIEWVATSSLTPNPRNARKHSDRQVSQIAASIRRFGFKVPLVVDQNGMVASGNGRLSAARQLGMDKVPIIRAEFLSEDDLQAFALADNRLAELSEWDDERVKEELERLFEGGFDIEITGFSVSDLDFSVPDEPAKNEPEKVELPDPASDAVTRPGDLWQIGPHRLLCGDSREVAAWEMLLGDQRVALVFADPPYNVPIDGHVCGNGRNRHREFVMGAGEMTGPEFIAFLRAIFRNCVRFSKPGSIHYVCMDWRHMREILDASDGVYDQFKQLIVWVKGVGGQGAFYRSEHELVFVFKAGKGKHTNNFGLGETGRYRTNVVSYPGANSFRKGRARDLADHSTVKPTALVADFLLDCSNRGDVVLDPCAGSGTTLIAAHRTHRVGVGIEIDPLYVDTAIRRLADACGLSAVLEGDGRSFDEIAAARRQEREG
jgi:DNA modification methylase